MASPRRHVPTIAEMRMEMVARIGAGCALIVVLASFAYSFAQIKWVSDQLGVEPEVLSFAFPFIIDLPAVVASALTVALHDRPFRQRLYAWAILVVFTSLSWVCNGVHAISHSSLYNDHPSPWIALLTVTIAGFPPIGVVLGMHLWAFALRHSASAETAVRIPAPAQSTSAPTARASSAPRAHTPAAPARASAPPTGPTARASTDEAYARARAIFDDMVAADPTRKPPANVIQQQAGVPGHPGNFRKYVQRWWEETEAARGSDAAAAIEAEIIAATPARDPIVDEAGPVVPEREDSVNSPTGPASAA